MCADRSAGCAAVEGLTRLVLAFLAGLLAAIIYLKWDERRIDYEPDANYLAWRDAIGADFV